MNIGCFKDCMKKAKKCPLITKLAKSTVQNYKPFKYAFWGIMGFAFAEY